MTDECLPRRLKRELPGHDVSTVQEMGWSGTKNGALLQLAATAGFEAFVTVDRRIQHQQNVSVLPFGIIALRARSNDVDDLRPLMSAVRDALTTLSPGQFVRIPP